MSDSGLPFVVPKAEDFKNLIEQFPFPVQIFSLDGTARYINKACLDLIGILTVESHIGHYNVFRDPIVTHHHAEEEIKRVLSGEVVVLTDFMASYREMMKHFKVADRDVSGISSDIFNFPIYNEDGSMDYFASVFVIRTLYKGNEEVARVRQYLQEHWLEPYDSTQIANLARLSKSHFSKLFKKQVGVTPYQYYIDLKINNLKSKLLEPNLSVAQAFAECNLDYNGHYAKLFRDKVGVSPSEYRHKPV